MIPPLPPFKWTAIKDSSDNRVGLLRRSSNGWEIAIVCAFKLAVAMRMAN